MKREFLQSIKIGEESLPKDIIDAIMEKNGQDIQAAKGLADGWEEKYRQAVEDHQKQLSELRMQGALERAVLQAGGRNQKAIAALLDMQAIAQAQDMSVALQQAIDGLKEENPYLFDTPTPPAFAPFTGSGMQGAADTPTTLAPMAARKATCLSNSRRVSS